MSEPIKVYNGPEVVRVFTEDQSDERADYQEKAKEFADKNGFTLKAGKEVAEVITPVVPEEPKSLGASEENLATKPVVKKKVVNKK